MTHEPPTRRFTAVFAATAAVVFLLVVAINALADVHGVLGVGRYQVSSFEWVDREAKAELLARAAEPPELVVLGSSTARAVDPELVDIESGKRTFNAGVSAGTPLDAYVFTSLAFAQAGEAPAPHILWMLDVESLREIDPNPALLRVPALSSQLGRIERARLAAQVYAPLLSLGTLDDSLRTIRRNERPAAGRANFRVDGFRLAEPLEGTDPAEQRERQVERYARTIYADERQSLDGRASDYFERTIELANEHDVTPTIVLTPVHPDARERLGAAGWDARHELLVDYLENLQQTHVLRVVDLTDVRDFGGSPEGFYDGIHLREQNMQLLIEHLASSGAI